MAAVLPLLFAALAASLIRGGVAGEPYGRRESLLGGAVLAGLLATALAELSSLFRAFDRSLVLGAWLAALLVLAAAVWRQSRRQAGAPPAVSIGRPSAQEIGFLLGLGVLAVAVVLAAAASAPSNWDSLTYHLPRIAHWIQNRSVAHYPTHVVRQLTLGPGAEELLAHFELLAGSDRGIGLLQFLAWVGAGVAASVVAADLGAGRLVLLAAELEQESERPRVAQECQPPGPPQACVERPAGRRLQEWLEVGISQ